MRGFCIIQQSVRLAGWILWRIDCGFDGTRDRAAGEGAVEKERYPYAKMRRPHIGG